ncbi:MAG: HlyD family efflux transporter periplasmic adaptor subunit [Planctomycetota bacterium]
MATRISRRLSSASQFSRGYRSPKSGAAVPLVILVVAALILAGGTAYFVLGNKNTESLTDEMVFASVTEGEFVSQVLDQGEVQSSENVEIRCEVRARSGTLSVIEVCPEGSMVSEGDFLVRLDSSAFEKELQQQRIKVTAAETARIQAKAAVDAAIATEREYIEGIFEENKKQIENEIFDAQSQIETAGQDLSQAEAVYEYTSKLLSRGFATELELEADGFAVTKAELALARGENARELAETKMRVLTEITFVKETVQLQADIEAANVKYNNEIEALEVERGELAEIEEQIRNCTIVVPEGVSGQVVYAKESSRGGNDWVLEEGTSVRERQVLIRLPNPEMMEIKASIAEQSITLVRAGMPVSIEVDALTGPPLQGIVTKVNQYAESNGWMSSSIRKYAVFIKIFDPSQDAEPSEIMVNQFNALKPGMNASVNIQVQYEPSGLLAPIQTIYTVQDRSFCLARTADGNLETREIDITGNNSREVMVASGVVEGEELVMNPGAFKELMDLPDVTYGRPIEIDRERLETAAEDLEEEAATGATSEEAGGGQRGGGPGRGGPGGSGQGSGGPGGGGGGFSMSGIIDRIMEADTNGDDKLDADEIAAMDSRMADRAPDWDSNGDGELTRDEIEKGMEAAMRRFQQGAGGGGPGGSQ